jgi:hypothetical protein
MNVYFLSHNGLGDNLFSIGAVRLLLEYYGKIYFLCKDKYYDNVKLFFIDEPRIVCVPFNHINEAYECYNIISNNYIDNDIFICGTHKRYLKSKITNKKYLEYCKNNFNKKSEYTLNCDTINDENYGFIIQFYNDIFLNIDIFFKYWYLPYTEISKKIYNSIKDYNIIFIQSKSSDNKKLNISNIVNKYLNDTNTLLVCNDENLYANNNTFKYELLNNIMGQPIIYYLDTIINSKEIYIIDSCFIGIILPLHKLNRLNANIIRIILRNQVDNTNL